MTHHSEPAEAVAPRVPDLSTESAVAFLIVCAEYFERRPTGGEDAAHWANVSNGAMCRKIATMLSASPAPAAGGLEADRALIASLAAIVRAQNGNRHDDINSLLARADAALISPAATSAETQGGDGVREAAEALVADVKERTKAGMSWGVHGHPTISPKALYDLTHALAALAPSTSAATSGPTYAVNCCNCGRIIDTREESEGGDQWGHELSDDRWVCSPECLDAVTDPEASPAATRGEPVYRFPRIGDVIEAGDECPSDNCGAWEPVNRWAVGMKMSVAFKTIRRRVASPTDPAVESAQVKVKPLEWREFQYTPLRVGFEARTEIGGWRVFEFDDGWAWWRNADSRSAYLTSEASAKAAAQADYETRIRASLATDAEG